jgi:hypothetical protein
MGPLVSSTSLIDFRTRQTAIAVTSRARHFIKILLEIKEMEGYSYGALHGPISRERDAEGG